MFIVLIVVVIELLGDGLVLLVHPVFYRRCMGYFEEMLGVSWLALVGWLLVAGGGVVLIGVMLAQMPVLFMATGFVVAGFGGLCLLASTGRYSDLGTWLSCRSNRAYRMIGALFVLLSVPVMRVAMEIRHA